MDGTSFNHRLRIACLGGVIDRSSFGKQQAREGVYSFASGIHVPPLNHTLFNCKFRQIPLDCFFTRARHWLVALALALGSEVGVIR